MEAVHKTCVSPHLIKQDPSAWRVTPVSIETARIWPVSRPEGLIKNAFRQVLVGHSAVAGVHQPRSAQTQVNRLKNVEAVIDAVGLFPLMSPPQLKRCPMTDTGKILEEMNDRSREVFRRVVEGYLQTGDPVRSEELV